jgi:hypothetical protein
VEILHGEGDDTGFVNKYLTSPASRHKAGSVGRM